MTTGLAYYTAVDAVLILDKDCDARNDPGGLGDTLVSFGLDRAHVAQIADAVKSDADDAANRLAAAFLNVSASFPGAISAMDPRLARVAQEMITDEMRIRLRPTGVAAEIGILLSRAMCQMVNLVGDGATVGFRVKRCMDGGRHHAADVLELEISLPNGITWISETGKAERVRIASDLPETVINALTGRTLDVVFEHPILGDRPPIIESIADAGPWQTFRLKAA